jgi:nitroreductase
MELNQLLQTRQSIRKFKDLDIPEARLRELIQAAGTAPSGKNMQNWHFVVIQQEVAKRSIREIIENKNEEIARKMDAVDPEKAQRFRKFTKNFTLFATEAPVLILVFAENYIPSGYREYQLVDAPQEVLEDLLYHRNPGMQNIGAALQTLTLKAVDMGYGTCWLTSGNYAGKEIEAWAKEEEIFFREGYFLVAMMALGVPEEGAKSPGRKPLEEIYTYIK